MQTIDMTLGDLVYRLTRGRDPPWNNDASKGAMPPRVYRRPNKLVEWARAVNPLQLFFCNCGRLREVAFSHGYMHRILWPKMKLARGYYVGLCEECGELARLGISNGHYSHPPHPPQPPRAP